MKPIEHKNLIPIYAALAAGESVKIEYRKLSAPEGEANSWKTITVSYMEDFFWSPRVYEYRLKPKTVAIHLNIIKIFDCANLVDIVMRSDLGYAKLIEYYKKFMPHHKLEVSTTITIDIEEDERKSLDLN